MGYLPVRLRFDNNSTKSVLVYWYCRLTYESQHTSRRTWCKWLPPQVYTCERKTGEVGWGKLTFIAIPFSGIVIKLRIMGEARSVNVISISGMLSGQWKVKPRWPPMEAILYVCFSSLRELVRQFQSPMWYCWNIHCWIVWPERSVADKALDAGNVFQVVISLRVACYTHKDKQRDIHSFYFRQ